MRWRKKRDAPTLRFEPIYDSPCLDLSSNLWSMIRDFLKQSVCSLCLWGLSSTLLVAEPVRLIFDTDMDSDCDDAAALAMVHALADKGEVRILATMVSSKHPWSAPCTDAINTYYGRPNLPIGVPKGPGAIEQGSRYARQIAEEFP
ncbi:MAG TPA: hypothetical protein VNZ22_15025, partial [Bacillota bacterium]|nr:hypothetical protein [Bacillota bacterium]